MVDGIGVGGRWWEWFCGLGDVARWVYSFLL